MAEVLDMTGKGMLAIDIARELRIPYNTLTSKIRRERVKEERAQKPVETDPDGGFDSGDGYTNYDPVAEAAAAEKESEANEEMESVYVGIDHECPVMEPVGTTPANPELLREAIMARASIHVDKVLKDPVALALMKELLAQGVA